MFDFIPIPFIFAGVAVLLPAIALWNIRRRARARAEIHALLERDGFNVHNLEPRWLTRGPFPEMRLPGSKNNGGDSLYHVIADKNGQPQTGYVRWRLRWLWQDAEIWPARWDTTPTAPSGLSSLQFHGLLLVAIALFGCAAAAIWFRMIPQ